jgi:hypothetical protein
MYVFGNHIRVLSAGKHLTTPALVVSFSKKGL